MVLPVANSWDGSPAMPIKVHPAPRNQKLTGFKSIAGFDLLDLHRFPFKETGLKDAAASSEETGEIEVNAHVTRS